MLAKCCGFKTEKYLDWSGTMTPDVYRHRPPTLGQKRFSVLRPKIAQGSRSANTYPNDDYSFIRSHLFTKVAPLESITHTLGKRPSSVRGVSGKRGPPFVT